MTNEELASQIITSIGGDSNVKSLTHCVTRLRFQLEDGTLFLKEQLEALPGVLGAQVKNGQYQVIVGTKVSKIYRIMVDQYPHFCMESSRPEPTDTKESIWSRLIGTLSAILIPSLPPVIGGGMLKGLIFLLTSLKLIDPVGGTYFILNLAGDAMFYFFPFLLAVSSAKRFRTNEYMALSLAGVLMYPTLLDAALQGKVANISFLSVIPIPVVNYSSSILPIILAVYLFSYLYRYLEKVIPSMITVIFTPLLSLMIIVPIMLFGIAPLGFYLGEYIAKGIEVLIDFSPLLAGFVIGGTRPLLVLTGMHHAVRPLTQQQIATFGFSTMGAMNFMSTMAQATAALAISLAINNKTMKQVALSSAFSGYLGVTEPALYGVLVKYRSAFIGAAVGGGIGGGIGASLGARALAPVMPSVLSFPVYLGEAAFGFLLAFVITIVSTFILTFLLSKGMDKKETAPLNPHSETKIKSPVSGQMYPIEEVDDDTFSKGLLGKGVAIKPEEDLIVSPVAGKVQLVFKTKHAIGLLADNGAEILIHVGLNTVELEGENFEVLCHEQQKVEVGTPLVRFDRAALVEAGYDDSVIMVIANTDHFEEIAAYAKRKALTAMETIIQLKIKPI